MAFFDSPKNMALWNKELESLDAERERRREEGYKPELRVLDGTGKKPQTMDNPKVRRITLKELEEIERRARAELKDASEMRGGMQKRAGREKSTPVKEASATM